MNKVISTVISLLISGMVITSIIGYPFDIYNSIHTSSIFSVSIISFLIIFIFIFYQPNKKNKITNFDVFVLFFLTFYIIKNNTTNSLWNAGCFILLLLCISIKIMGNLKYQYIYYSALVALFILSAWGYLQYFELTQSNNVNFQITGPFHNPGILGGVMSVLLIIILSATIQLLPKLQKCNKFFYAVIFTIAFSLPVFTLTSARAAWFALITSISYVYYINHKQKLSTRKKVVYLFCTICSFVLLLGFIYNIKPLSAHGRILIWKVSWQMIKDKPISGFGKGGFEANYLYYQAAYLEEKASDIDNFVAGNTHIAFNEVIRFSVEHGIIGFLAYTTFILLTFLLPMRNDVISNVSKSVIFNITIWGMFSYPDRIFVIITLFTIAYAILLNRNSYQLKINLVQKKSLFKTIQFSLFVIAIPMIMYIVNCYNLYSEFYTYKNSLKIEEIANDIKYTYFKEKMPNDIGMLTLHAHILYKRKEEDKLIKAINIVESIYPTPSLFIQKGDLFQRTQNITEAEKAYKLAAAMIPTRQKARYKLALLYHSLGRESEAVYLAKALLSEKVKNYGFETYEMHQNLKKIFREML